MGFMGWTVLSYAFQGCPIVNIGVSNGSEFANVTNMAGMFYEAETANPNTTNWQTQNVTNMSVMFFGAFSANPVVSGWNVSNVTDMSGLFAGAVIANPNVSNWNVSNVTNMNGMFFTALSANPDTRLWNVQNVTNFEGIFSKEEGVPQNSSLSNLNYSRFLVMVEDTSPLNNLVIGPVESAFQPFAATARSSLLSRGWIIMDEGPE
jgi:hypothetical protein